MKCSNDFNLAVGTGAMLLIGVGLILGGVLRDHSVVAIGALCGSGTALSAFALYAIATRVNFYFKENQRTAEQEEALSAEQRKQQ